MADEDKCQRRLNNHACDSIERDRVCALPLSDEAVDTLVPVEAGAAGGEAVFVFAMNVFADGPIAACVSPTGSVTIDRGPLPLQVCTSYLYDDASQFNLSGHQV